MKINRTDCDSCWLRSRLLCWYANQIAFRMWICGRYSICRFSTVANVHGSHRASSTPVMWSRKDHDVQLYHPQFQPKTEHEPSKTIRYSIRDTTRAVLWIRRDLGTTRLLLHSNVHNLAQFKLHLPQRSLTTVRSIARFCGIDRYGRYSSLLPENTPALVSKICIGKLCQKIRAWTRSTAEIFIL